MDRAARLADLEKQISAQTALLEQAEDTLADAKSRDDALAGSIAKRETELAELERQIEATQLELTSLQAKRSAEKVATSANTVTDAPPAAVEIASPSQSNDSGPIRAPALVDAALRSAPGLPLEATERTRELRLLLEAGACPVDALRETFGQINRQTLVALVRVLGSC